MADERERSSTNRRSFLRAGSALTVVGAVEYVTPTVAWADSSESLSPVIEEQVEIAEDGTLSSAPAAGNAIVTVRWQGQDHTEQIRDIGITNLSGGGTFWKGLTGCRLSASYSRSFTSPVEAARITDNTGCTASFVPVSAGTFGGGGALSHDGDPHPISRTLTWVGPNFVLGQWPKWTVSGCAVQTAGGSPGQTTITVAPLFDVNPCEGTYTVSAVHKGTRNAHAKVSATFDVTL